MLLLCDRARITAKRERTYDRPHAYPYFYLALYLFSTIASKNCTVVKTLEIVLHFGFIEKKSVKKVALH